MATTITSQNPKIKSERSFRDLDLAFNIHPIKKDITKHVNEYAVINSVKNLVSTNFYERPFRPEIGSSIKNLLFENVDPQQNQDRRPFFVVQSMVLFQRHERVEA